MKTAMLAAMFALSGCAQPPISPSYVVCTSAGGKEARTAVSAEWLFLDGSWKGYEYRGDARAFPIASYTPKAGEICEVKEYRS